MSKSRTNRFVSLAIAFGSLCLPAAPILAQPAIDQTCASCSRRANDSLNLKVRNIRVNQAGYLPQDPDKAAFVANPAGTAFTLVDYATRKPVFSGTLKSVGAQTEGGMDIYEYYSSITPLDSLKRDAKTIQLYRADFSAFTTPGRYRMACGADTSAVFRLDPKIYNEIFETSLKFFGSNRCGPTHSWIHKDCHLKDGDALGAAFSGKLAGGWHDCGDHGKYSETEGYAAVVLAMTYAFWPQKGEDFYGASYNDTLPFGTDDIPDVLYEAKVGADYILNLYKASVANGLLAKGDMYHSVGTGPGVDHSYWDVPEHQDVQPQAKGGPARLVSSGIGSNVAGMFAAALAFFAWGWEPFDPAYARECLNASADIYAKIVIARRNTATVNPCCYPGGGVTNDDEALAAFALWYATKDPKYKADLFDNASLGADNQSQFNQGIFPTGLLANSNHKFFTPGGWPTDYENVHTYVLYGLVKLVLGSPAAVSAYGLDPIVADSLKKDCITALYTAIRDGAGGGTTQIAPGLKADEPYHGVSTAIKWGFNRYNMGVVLELFMYWDLTKDPVYYDIGIDNLNYVLGMNPWDISFVMGAGEKNLQHPHNRAANPEGYNAGGLPYKYQSPKGALMGGCHPKERLLDRWDDWVNTETCIDFSAQLLIPTQMLALDLPEDKQGPDFRNVNVYPDVNSAIVTWSTDEISRDTLFLLDGPGGKLLQTVPAPGLTRDKQVEIKGLVPNTTYWFWLKGMDIRRNVTEDKNGGEYYSFTTKTASVDPQFSGVRVCNETHESALVTWWTRNGLYTSEVDYGKTKPPAIGRAPDDAGTPVYFHRVTLTDLEAATKYWYLVKSGNKVDDSSGGFYSFTTSQVLVDYTIRIKPTNKASSGKSAHFYIDVANNEGLPYTGLELRFYFKSDAATAATMVAKGFDNQVFDVGGVPSVLDIAYGAAKAVPGMDGVWYFPITLNSTLPVAGRARFELQINAGGGGWGDYAFSNLKDAWSIRAHAKPADPVDFPGVDLSKGETGVYKDPEMVVNVDGKNVLTYVEDPYITAYYKGVHVFGYAPDAQADPLKIQYAAKLDLTAPVKSPLEQIDLRQEDGGTVLSGTASITPGGHIDAIVVNGADLPASDLTRNADGTVSFAHALKLAEGTNVFDVIAWDTAHCAVDARHLVINWRKGPPEPPPQVQTPVADPKGKSVKDSIAVSLSTATKDAAIWYTLDGKDPSPGAAGSMAYTGAIVIKASATLKAIAAKPGWKPSGILSETYGISKYAVVNPSEGRLLDTDADGRADAVSVPLDRAGAALDTAISSAQAAAARWTGGWVATGFKLTPDTLAFGLAANSLPVRDRRDSLILPPPGAETDGMLRAGPVALRDGVAPVLRTALLRRGSQGAPDSLQLGFSESIRPIAAGAVFPGRSPSGTYAFALGAGSLLPASAGANVWLFPIVSVTDASARPVGPAAGDSVWIDPSAGVADSVGNAQSNPGNSRVPLRIRTLLTWSIKPPDSTGVARLPSGAQGPQWSVYAGTSAGPRFGFPPFDLPTIRVDPADRPHAGVLDFEATHPFFADLAVYDNLGQFVSRVRLDAGPGEFEKLPPGRVPGTRGTFLVWNGTTDSRGHAATGAYVFVWRVRFQPDDGAPQIAQGKRIIGILREH
jgi:hypothetical protein